MVQMLCTLAYMGNMSMLTTYSQIFVSINYISCIHSMSTYLYTINVWFNIPEMLKEMQCILTCGYEVGFDKLKCYYKVILPFNSQQC